MDEVVAIGVGVVGTWFMMYDYIYQDSNIKTTGLISKWALTIINRTKSKIKGRSHCYNASDDNERSVDIVSEQGSTADNSDSKKIREPTNGRTWVKRHNNNYGESCGHNNNHIDIVSFGDLSGNQLHR